MAEFLMKNYVQKKGKEKEFVIESSATSSEELGHPVHYGTRRVLDKLNISYHGKYAVKLKKEDYYNYDYFIGMEEDNLYAMRRIFGADPDGKISKIMDYTSNPRDVADPYWTGDFEATYRDVKEGVSALYDFIKDEKR
jgi:protein-tyrosine phosphatase